MDKYELVLDIIDHPENYSPDELARIMADTETKEIYNLLCKTETAARLHSEVDVDAEWKEFSEAPRRRITSIFSRLGSRAAIITAVICTSFLALAVGIAVSVGGGDKKSDQLSTKPAEAEKGAVVAEASEEMAVSDSLRRNLAPVMFEDVALEKILEQVAGIYGVELRFNNNEVGNLHLYYKFDPSLPLSTVVDQLNTFEQIQITQTDNILEID